jgi:hypothetical protein
MRQADAVPGRDEYATCTAPPSAQSPPCAHSRNRASALSACCSA